VNKRKWAKPLNRIILILFALFLLKSCVIDKVLPKGLFGGGGAKGGKDQAAQQNQSAIPVKIFQADRYDFEDSLLALGTIKGQQEFKLSFEVPGIISQINFKRGDAVKKGELIAALKQEDIQLRIDRAEAQARKADADIQLAQRRYDDNEKLFNIGAIPKTSLERLKLELDKARYDMEVAEVELKASESVMDKSSLLAVEDGIIGDLNVEPGEGVTPNTLVCTLIVVSQVEAKFGVLEKDLAKVQIGQKAQVMVDAYPGKVFEGTIVNVSRQITGQTRTSDAWVAIDNPNRELLPGMFARIKVTVYKAENVVVIPSESIQMDEERRTFVYVVDLEKSIALRSAVQVGYQRSDYSHIESGVTEGQWVVTTGFQDLKDQSPVDVVEMQEKVF